MGVGSGPTDEDLHGFESHLPHQKKLIVILDNFHVFFNMLKNNTRMIGIILTLGVIFEIIIGTMLVTPTNSMITLLHGFIGIVMLGVVLYLTKNLKPDATPITKYTMVLASILFLFQIISGLRLLTGSPYRYIDHSIIAILILLLFLGHAGYSMYLKRTNK